MRYLLDTNVITGIMRRNLRVEERLRRCRSGDAILSSVVLTELYFGAVKSARTQFYLDAIDALGLPHLPFDEGDAKVTGGLRSALQARGMPIGPYDVMIAGQALARELVLVTHNQREFSRVDGLEIEDWEA